MTRLTRQIRAKRASAFAPPRTGIAAGDLLAVADAVVSKGVAEVPEALYGVGYVRISNSCLESWDWRMID